MNDEIQVIMKLANQIKEESSKALSTQTGVSILNSKIKRFVFEQIQKHASDILSLVIEKHTFSGNYYHPEVIKRFPEKLKEGASDIVYCLVPNKPNAFCGHHKLNPTDINSEGERYDKWFNLNRGHPRNGGCWTLQYAKKLNKETHLVAIE